MKLLFLFLLGITTFILFFSTNVYLVAGCATAWIILFLFLIFSSDVNGEDYYEDLPGKEHNPNDSDIHPEW